MKPSKENPSIDRQLDKLLASSPVSASPGFEAAVMARLRNRDADASLDALLKNQTVKASDDFTEKTLALIFDQTGKPAGGKRIVFPRIFWWAGAAAAMLVAGLFAAQSFLGPSRVDPVMAENTQPPTPSSYVEERAITVLADMEALFVLVDGLSDAELFLDDKAYATLDGLSYEEAALF